MRYDPQQREMEPIYEVKVVSAKTGIVESNNVRHLQRHHEPIGTVIPEWIITKREE